MVHPAAQSEGRGALPALAARRHEHLFFSGMALVLLATVFVGFARSYYLAGMHHAPLPGRVIHIHAIIATCWMLLFAVQVSLVAAHRAGLHRRFGIIGFLLACAMVVSGFMAGADTLRRNVPPGLEDLLFMVNTSMVAVFAVLVAFAFRMRAVPPVHKRLILMATIALTFASLIRWPSALLFHNIPAATRASYLFLLPVFVYDFYATRRIHRTTLWSSAFIVFVYEARFLVAGTGAWHAFAAWVRSGGS